MTRKGNGQASVAPAADIFHADGGLLVISGYQPRAWQELCRAIGTPNLADDPRFATNALRVENREELVSVIEERLRGRNAAETVSYLSNAGVVAALVRDYDDVLSAEDVTANRTFETTTTFEGQEYASPVSPLRSDPPLTRGTMGPAPRLNELISEAVATR
ncbi:CoA transferase [Gordonia iterans]